MSYVALRGAFGTDACAEVALLQTLEQGQAGSHTHFYSLDWSRGIALDDIANVSVPGSFQVACPGANASSFR